MRNSLKQFGSSPLSACSRLRRSWVLRTEAKLVISCVSGVGASFVSSDCVSRPESQQITERKQEMEKLKEWGPLLGTFAAVLMLTLFVSGWFISNANRNIDMRFEAQQQEADARHEAQQREADARHEALMGLIESQIQNDDARYESLMGQIEGVRGQVAGLEKQINGLQKQFDGLNRNADARNDSLKEQANSAKQAINTLSREMGALIASLDIDQRSGDDLLEILESIVKMLDVLHERVDEFESMIELDEVRFEAEFKRQETQPVSLE